jgi:nucleotide-binding universal stress UspA family protein
MPVIVVGMDGSTSSHRALEWAAREAALRHAQLTVLTVVPTLISPWTRIPEVGPGDVEARETARRAAQEAVDKVTSELGDARPDSVTVTAVVGSPSEELVAASRDADLLVVGSRGTGGFAALIMGSVSGQVVGHAASPVVVVPGKR